MNQMQPSYYPLLLCLLGIMLSPDPLSGQGFASGVQFFDGSLQQLQTEAESLQRPYLISVYTNWCDPCQDLNNRTFTDVGLSHFINSHYLVYRLNPEYQINRSDGDLLAEYDITFYPTLLIFDANGELMHKLSGYQSPENLHWVLEEMLPTTARQESYGNQPPTTLMMEGEDEEVEDDFPLFASASDTPDELIGFNQQEEPLVYDRLSSQSASPYSKPLIKDRRTHRLSSQAPSAHSQPVVEDRRIAFLETESVSNIDESIFPETAEPIEEELLIAPPPPSPPSTSYGVQIGVFADYANVRRNLRQMQPIFRPELQVETSTFQGKSVYKMIFGPFENLYEAERFMRIYTRRMGLDAVIVNQTH